MTTLPRWSRRAVWVAGVSLGLAKSAVAADPGARPNVLFIVADDLNHWVGHLGRNPQARTPNIDRPAKMGVTFTRANCPGPAWRMIWASRR